MLSQKAEAVWPLLSGIICVYKPSGASCEYVKNKLRVNLCNDLNSLKVRPPGDYVEVNYSNAGVSVNVRPSYADNILCVGPRYQPQDIEITFPFNLIKAASGVLVVGINNGFRVAKALKKCYFTKCYHLTGLLGQATEDFYSDSKILARAKYDHINKYLIDKVLASYQNVNQRRIFEEYGLHLTSQEAYDFAVAGLFRPKKSGGTIVYSLKAVDLKPPDFTIEMQCINEGENYLKNTVHNLGVSLKCLASCSSIRCIRQGCFNVENALLIKHWRLEHVLENMSLCQKILEKSFPGIINHTPTVTAAKNVEQQSR